jgi:iron complex outermembrane receptor protein
VRPGQRHTAVDETLALIPGLSSASRNNPSQDPRLSIRGFGSRSAFGVRGVRVLRDGMPLTLPDGQTPLDYLSLESVGRIEVMRGAASALYGNASGGVIDIISSEPSRGAVSVDGRLWAGEDGFVRSVLAASGTSNGVSYVTDAAHGRSDGTREHARHEGTTGFARVTLESGPSLLSLTFLGLHNPLAQNPGALTLDEMRSNPRLADPQSIRRNARKAVRQVQAGAALQRELGNGDASVSVFRGARSLDNPLPFAVVEIGRHTWGASASLRQQVQVGWLLHRVALGADFQSMNDLRRNFAACADTIPPAAPTVSCPDVTSERGIVTLDQRERVSSFGVYLTDDVELSRLLSATAGVRADNVRFEVVDRLISASNPDDSGERSLASVSPIVGLIARVSALASLYANVSSAFETPTATELGTQPDGSAGINPDLDPQKSLTFEAGIKGFAGAARYDAALYSTRVTDELVPFEVPGSDGRRYFRNAGSTSRRGAEAGVDVTSGPLSFLLSYSYSRFRFTSFQVGEADYSANRIPGIPEHRVQGAATLSRKFGFVSVETEMAGSSYTDDANTFVAPGYAVFHLRSGVTPLRGTRRLSLMAAVQNVFNRSYASSIAVNATRSRYFEPAASRTLSIALTIGATNR